MNKKTKKRLRLFIGATLTLFFAAITVTNETVDYLSKFGIENIQSGWLMMFTFFMFAMTLSWTLWDQQFN